MQDERAPSTTVRSNQELAARRMAAMAIDDPAAVAAYQETKRPVVTATTPSTAASAMVVGSRRVHCDAATAGASSRPSTSREPPAR